MMDFNNCPYAEWLEDTVKTIFEQEPVSMALVATLKNGDTLTGYYEASAQDKAVFAHHIQNDVTMDVILANVDILKSALDNFDKDISDV